MNSASCIDKPAPQRQVNTLGNHVLELYEAFRTNNSTPSLTAPPKLPAFIIPPFGRATVLARAAVLLTSRDRSQNDTRCLSVEHVPELLLCTMFSSYYYPTLCSVLLRPLTPFVYFDILLPAEVPQPAALLSRERAEASPICDILIFHLRDGACGTRGW